MRNVFFTCLYIRDRINHPARTPTGTVLPIRRVLITLVAETLEGTESVDTLTVPAHLALDGAALVYVC